MCRGCAPSGSCWRPQDQCMASMNLAPRLAQAIAATGLISSTVSMRIYSIYQSTAAQIAAAAHAMAARCPLDGCCQSSQGAYFRACCTIPQPDLSPSIAHAPALRLQALPAASLGIFKRAPPLRMAAALRWVPTAIHDSSPAMRTHSHRDGSAALLTHNLQCSWNTSPHSLTQLDRAPACSPPVLHGCLTGRAFTHPADLLRPAHRPLPCSQGCTMCLMPTRLQPQQL